MRERRVRVCARSVCDDDDAQNGEKSRRGVKGMFCKSSARRFRFVVAVEVEVFSERERKKRDFHRKRQKKRDFQIKAKKEILSKSFFSCRDESFFSCRSD